MTCMFCGRQATHEIRNAPCCERCRQKLQHILEDEEDDIRDIPGMWCDDITFCQEQCDWLSCPRNWKNIRDKTVPHSFSVNIPEDCPKNRIIVTTQPWGNYVAINGTPDNMDEVIPECFKKLYKSVIDGIRAKGLTPDYETLQIIVKLPEIISPRVNRLVSDCTTIGVRINAEEKVKRDD